MVLIVSEWNDSVTSTVCDWLVYYGTPYVVINEHSHLTDFLYNGNDIEFKCDGQLIALNKLTAYWYRRGELIFEEMKYQIDATKVKADIHSEHSRYLELIHQKLFTLKRRLGALPTRNVNRLTMLEKGKEIGLKVPEVIVTNSSDDLIKFLKNVKAVITKPVEHGFCEIYKENFISNYSELLTEATAADIPPKFGYSFFSEYIDKLFEVRSFFLNGTSYSIAMHSQATDKTRIDYRKGGGADACRCYPYILPQDIEFKTANLLKQIGLQTASVDFIYSVSDEYVFLEANPVGQFENVSVIGNYYLEQKIAAYLAHG